MTYLPESKDKNVEVRLLSELPKHALHVNPVDNHRSVYKQIQAELRYENTRG